MSNNKTRPVATDPYVFVASIENDTRRRDAEYLIAKLKDISGEKPQLWGPSIIGFGQYHYKYESGREGDWFVAGFAPRKQETVVYLMGTIADQAALLAKLGKHKMGRSCLYVKDLSKVDKAILEKLLTSSIAAIRSQYCK